MLHPVATPHSPRVLIASYLLVASTLLLVMVRGLLPGLLCVSGLFVSRAGWRRAWYGCGATCLVAEGPPQRPSLGGHRGHRGTRYWRWRCRTRAAICSSAPLQYRELLDFMARTVLELGVKLPPDMAAQLPEGAADIQRAIAAYLAGKAGMLATTGRAWLGGLHAYVGLLIGALAAVRLRYHAWPSGAGADAAHPFAGDAFRQIVAAQF